MLYRLNIKNFKSIVDLTLDMSFGQKRLVEKDVIYALEPTKKIADRVVPVECIYGPNASGKSNIVKAIKVFREIVVDGLVFSSYQPNKLRFIKEPTCFSIEFFVNSRKYSYILAFDENSIVYEELIDLTNNISIYKIENQKTYFDNIDCDGFDYVLLDKIYETAAIVRGKDGQDYQKNTFLEKFVWQFPNLDSRLSDVFYYISNNIKIISAKDSLRAFSSIRYLADSDKDEDICVSLDKISKFIQMFDVDVKRFEHKYKEYSQESLMNVEIPFDFIKNFDEDKVYVDDIIPYLEDDTGKDVPFNFHNELSVGTQEIFKLAGLILGAVEKGVLIIIDEMDRSIHPKVLEGLIKRFKYKNLNKNGAQLIATLHTTDILENKIYKTDEFAFVNKNKKNGSVLVRLSSIEKRNEVNFRDRYVSGMYRGQPIILD
ncbi:MAG: AAA family ATPase [Alphaproteobacteria bacterium]|nr:AAA family ATPase [Alphaproteobacteria bacterium]